MSVKKKRVEGHRSNRVTIGVNNLEAFRKALARKGPRTIVFTDTTDGYGNMGYVLRSEDHEDLVVEHGDLILDGSLFQHPVTIYGARLVLKKVKNVTIRHMRFRLGAAGFYRNDGKGPRTEREAISIDGCRDINLEFNSFSWGTDETLAIVSSKRIFVNGNLISEPLNMPKDVNGKWLHSEKNPHGYAFLIRGSEVVLTNNLIVHSLKRNPSVSPDGKYPPKVLVSNNVIYDYGEAGTKFNSGGSSPKKRGHSIYMTVVGNYYCSGHDDHGAEIVFEKPSKDWKLKLYTADNYVEHLGDDHRARIRYTKKDNKGKLKRRSRYNLLKKYEMEVAPAEFIKEEILATAGAHLPKREAIDLRIIQEIKEKKTGFIDHESQTPEYAYYSKIN